MWQSIEINNTTLVDDTDEIEELEKWAKAQYLDCSDFDDMIHDLFSSDASNVNNNGLFSQLQILSQAYGGFEEVKQIIRENFCITEDAPVNENQTS